MSQEKRQAPPQSAPPIPQISADPSAQTDSPLFSTIPAEIRQRIYTFTLHAFDDPSKPFNLQHHHYRPGHEYGPKYDLRLLQTCKRIYHEARLLPVSLNEVTIYLYRGPLSNLPAYSQYDWRARYRILNEDQRDVVHTVQIFARQCYLESNADLLIPGSTQLGYKQLREVGLVTSNSMIAKRIILTFRRSDWWSWESPPMSNDQLGICPWRRGRTDWKQMEAEPLGGPPQGEWEGWGGQFRYVRGLETLEIEFETVETKKRQLERVVRRAKYWRFPLDDDRVLAWTGNVKESTWVGAVSLKEDNGDRAVRLRSVQGDGVDIKPLMCTYVVMAMTWRVTARSQVD
jgi:hypothetical protein